MSIELMTLAWKTDLPSGRKLVLLALCDHANNHGQCYPSIEAISRKCSMGQRTIQQHLGELEAVGILVRHFRSGRSTLYKVEPRNFCIPAAPAVLHDARSIRTISAPLPPQIPSDTAAKLAPIIVNEPSNDSSRKRQVLRGTRLPPAWELPRAWAEWALQQQPSWTAEHVHFVADKFRDHWTALPGQRGVKTDWLATWRNWCRNEHALDDDKAAGPCKWWTNDATVLAKGSELGIAPLPGESMGAFKNRIQRALENSSNCMPIHVPPATVVHLEESTKIATSTANRAAALHAARALKSRCSSPDMTAY
ncbi:helix-turn-helix domain-containing protein [Noviherbaspirillum pedocola]|uniref:Helix-turn-helix domain-containing protein n=1 Tax=Noviherbaspirillum pedocola TaxID=2801341 RepID=A0A934VZU1_9BURK|nr:helix-turn-helix domain-containing protein [Noviherbaspirillum pedocola]MBK4733391.1 helix-turn-helix domain-containing protein [Noviherbaspirillum pedocola]